MKLEIGDVIEFDYINWKGEKSRRVAFVYGIDWGSNAWHTEEQWLLHALDEAKNEARHFAMKDMSNVKKIEPFFAGK